MIQLNAENLVWGHPATSGYELVRLGPHRWAVVAAYGEPIDRPSRRHPSCLGTRRTVRPVQGSLSRNAAAGGALMSTVQVFTARIQPATRWADPYLPIGSRWCGWHQRRQLPCHNCGRVRWASNLSVQVYYDMFRIFCTDPVDCDRARKARRKSR